MTGKLSDGFISTHVSSILLTEMNSFYKNGLKRSTEMQEKNCWREKQFLKQKVITLEKVEIRDFAI